MGTINIRDLPHYTYDDYLSWEGKWEIIHGIAYAMAPAPPIAHQRISQKIARYLDQALDDCGQCQALLPVDWKISEDTVVQPDNLVICHTPEEGHITRSPVLIFEILSKSSAQKDQNTKYEIYEREGVKYYVIVDPWDQVAKVFELVSGRYQKLIDVENEKVGFDLGPCGVQLDFGNIWK